MKRLVLIATLALALLAPSTAGALPRNDDTICIIATGTLVFPSGERIALTPRIFCTADLTLR